MSISIIGILVALGTISFSSAQVKARDARRVEDMKVIQNAAEQYYASSGTYTYPVSSSTPWTAGGQTMLSVFPSDPKPPPWTAYSYSVSGGVYCACARMENVAAGNSNNVCGFGVATTYYCVKGQQ